jgi:hypothetical protein
VELNQLKKTRTNKFSRKKANKKERRKKNTPNAPLRTESWNKEEANCYIPCSMKIH